jgi:pimeloyl-ACP methyl ester carboxylesterase
MDALDLGSVAPAGHSMGGTLSLFTAVARPERVRALALFDPVIRLDTSPIRRKRATLSEQLCEAALFAALPAAAVVGVGDDQRHDRRRLGEHHLLVRRLDLAP